MTKKIDFESVFSSQEEFNEKFPPMYTQSFAEDVYDFFVYTIPRVIREFRFEVKMRYQMLTRGYTDRNVWNMYHDVAKLNIKLLTELRNSHFGSPSNLTEAKWNKVLDKMILGFQSVIDIENLEVNYTSKEYKKLEKQRKEGMELYVEYYRDLWD